jgi:hypothetical protein
MTMSKVIDLKVLENRAVLKLYADLIEELRERQLIRSSNNPVADYAEKVAVERLELVRVGKEERGYDATDRKGRRYQIKGRRITRHNKSRQLGVIRNLNERLFHFLVAVILDENFNVVEMWKIPYRFIKANSRWSKHQNGHIFNVYPDVLTPAKDVERII